MREPCPELVDRAVIAELQSSVGAKGAGDLLHTFFREAQERLGALRALTADRTESIRFYLHTLHGAAGMFGLARLSALLRQLHRKSGSLSPAAYRLALDEIAATLTASREALARLGLRPPSD